LCWSVAAGFPASGPWPMPQLAVLKINVLIHIS
jgi:hypothetical protein